MSGPGFRELGKGCKLAFVCVVIITNMFAAGTGWANDWLTYHNDRYGTTIEYPDVFKMQRPRDSDDGREFKSADGADFTVAALYNALDFTVAKYRTSSSTISIAAPS